MPSVKTGARPALSLTLANREASQSRRTASLASAGPQSSLSTISTGCLRTGSRQRVRSIDRQPKAKITGTKMTQAIAISRNADIPGVFALVSALNVSSPREALRGRRQVYQTHVCRDARQKRYKAG